MKKRTRKEKKEAFKQAYYKELQKQGVISTDNAQNVDKTKKELIEEAEKLGLEVNSRMTKAQLQELIDKESEK